MSNPTFDFSKVIMKIEQMEDLLKCNLCKSVPSGDVALFKVKACRHLLCQLCYNPGIWLGCCPVCKVKCDRKDVLSDHANKDFLNGLQEMKVLLVKHSINHEAEAQESKTFEEDGDVDLNKVSFH